MALIIYLVLVYYIMPFISLSQEELLLSLGLDVTVTRRKDATFAPNGYIYNVYFDGEAEVRNVACRD